MNPTFQQYLNQTGEYGIVTHVSHPIVFIEGLPKVKTHELVMFENGEKGEVFTINHGKVEARVFSREPIKPGTKTTRTDMILSIFTGIELLGKKINPMGDTLDSTDKYTRPKSFRFLDMPPGGIATRKKITKQLATGVSLFDLMIPLGRGQRELIIGDRKTGKTSAVLTILKKQIEEGSIAIYTAIAKKKSDIKKVQEFLEEEGLMEKAVIVATSSYDSPSLIYQTPYAAMAIAEYFRDEGQDTVIVFDDLSTHAKFYREISLLARRFPGRDSYPGDIFYIHSKLLERAGNYKHPKAGEVAITCFPVVEIVEGDLTGYVSTNLMGITDGHIYFDSNMYYKGMRPAVNIPLSVTRVGRQTLNKLRREINKELMSFLTQYDKLQNLSHFGQELSTEVKKTLARGEMIYAFFNQHYKQTLPLSVQLIILSMIIQGIIYNKNMLDKIRIKLSEVYKDDQKRKDLDNLCSTSNIVDFNAVIKRHRAAILSLCG